MKELHMDRILNRKRYDTGTATLLASDCYWDGHNWERRGRNTWLYRTRKGEYFTVTRTKWQGEFDILTPIFREQAIDLYETTLQVHKVFYTEAFPDVEVVDA